MCKQDRQKEADLYIIELLQTETTGLRNSCLCTIVEERAPEYQAIHFGEKQGSVFSKCSM